MWWALNVRRRWQRLSSPQLQSVCISHAKGLGRLMENICHQHQRKTFQFLTCQLLLRQALQPWPTLLSWSRLPRHADKGHDQAEEEVNRAEPRSANQPLPLPHLYFCSCIGKSRLLCRSPAYSCQLCISSSFCGDTLPDPSMASYVPWVAACVQSESPTCAFPYFVRLFRVYIPLTPFSHTQIWSWW